MTETLGLRTVITAAHCFESDYTVPKSISVTVGHLIKDDYSARKDLVELFRHFCLIILNLNSATGSYF